MGWEGGWMSERRASVLLVEGRGVEEGKESDRHLGRRLIWWEGWSVGWMAIGEAGVTAAEEKAQMTDGDEEGVDGGIYT